MEETWAAIDLPVLRAAVRYIEDHNYELLPQAYDLAPELGLSPEDVGRALIRLDGTYIRMSGTLGGLSHNMVNEIYPAARRAVGQWPTPEDFAEQLVAGLREAAENEPDSDKRSKLKQTAVFLGAGGKDLFVNLLATVIARGTGLS